MYSSTISDFIYSGLHPNRRSIMIEMSQWNVVIVDDEPDNIGVVEFIFGFHNVKMRSATSGAAGLEMLRQERSNLLLLDVQMPGMSGWDVLAEIRKDEN